MHYGMQKNLQHVLNKWQSLVSSGFQRRGRFLQVRIALHHVVFFFLIIYRKQ
jgi:hypothetical protein